jgi:hypothetical protein
MVSRARRLKAGRLLANPRRGAPIPTPSSASREPEWGRSGRTSGRGRRCGWIAVAIPPLRCWPRRRRTHPGYAHLVGRSAQRPAIPTTTGSGTWWAVHPLWRVPQMERAPTESAPRSSRKSTAGWLRSGTVTTRTRLVPPEPARLRPGRCRNPDGLRSGRRSEDRRRAGHSTQPSWT